MQDISVEFYGYLRLAQDRFLVLACDGIWDVLSDEEALRMGEFTPWYMAILRRELMILIDRKGFFRDLQDTLCSDKCRWVQSLFFFPSLAWRFWILNWTWIGVWSIWGYLGNPMESEHGTWPCKAISVCSEHKTADLAAHALVRFSAQSVIVSNDGTIVKEFTFCWCN